MKLSLITLALLGHIEAESLAHHSHFNTYRPVLAQEEPAADPTVVPGRSRLVNMTDADIKAMNTK